MNKLILVSVVLCGLFGCSLGWGKDGHMMIAQIAADLLNPTATKIVQQFIGSQTLAAIAPMPDDYAHTPQGKWSEPCHFCNLPRSATNFQMSYCPKFCVVKSIQNYTTILQNEQSNPQPCDFTEGVEPCALEFLVHYVGDVHQPLHVGYGDDEGGNTISVTFFGEDSNLHKVWDDNMIWRWEGNNDWSWGAEQLETLMQSPNETALIKQYLSDMNPIDWATESFHYVMTTCYNYTGGSNETFPGDYSPLSAQQTPALGEYYYNHNLPIVMQRLIAAGVRLASLLNTILTGDVATPIQFNM